SEPASPGSALFQHYDVQEISRYYRWRFLRVFARALSVSLRLLAFYTGLQFDRLNVVVLKQRAPRRRRFGNCHAIHPIVNLAS
ncbi:MAG: hypothetical protein AAGJ55_10470, partial [Cyanobacteria bacterium J06555_12]